MSTITLTSPSKPRGSLKRRLSEFLIRKSLARQSFPASSRKSLGPSVNPVRKSVVDTGNLLGKDEFVVHYNRKIHSHLTIDAHHEAFYEKVGLPRKPLYNPHGRRFSGSSETDPDYDKDEFKRQATVLNNKPSVTDTIRSNSIDPSEASSRSPQGSRSKARNSELTAPGQSKSGSVRSSVDSRRSSSSRRNSTLAKYHSIAIARRAAARTEESNSGCMKTFLGCIRFCICCTRPERVGPATKTNTSLIEPETMDESMTSSFTTVGGDKGNKASQRRTSLGITPSLAVFAGNEENKTGSRRTSVGSSFSAKYGHVPRRKSGT